MALKRDSHQCAVRHNRPAHLREIMVIPWIPLFCWMHPKTFTV